MIPLARIATLIPSLGRENNHEVFAAARAIGAALTAAGHDWHDLAEVYVAIALADDVATPSAVPPLADTKRALFGDLARACRDLDRGRLSPRERSFVADMVSRGFVFRPSSRQAAWIDDILARLQGKAAA